MKLVPKSVIKVFQMLQEVLDFVSSLLGSFDFRLTNYFQLFGIASDVFETFYYFYIKISIFYLSFVVSYRKLSATSVT